ncbi:MAG: MMPL family transporter, partial [Pseudomonadota bacterium]|nr:MMPL family transporter [Pseudomonadota bacterium]
ASYEMIFQLNLSLLSAIASIILLIALSMRSWRAGLVSILPNILPIAVAGAWLYLSGRGLQFTSVVGFTIGFGIAVDSTIHVLNAIRVERGVSRAKTSVLERAVHNVGPALIVSTIVLIAGVSATLFSELPIVQLYGQIVSLVLFTGLITAMLFLPSLVSLTGTALRRWGALREPKATPRKA